MLFLCEQSQHIRDKNRRELGRARDRTDCMMISSRRGRRRAVDLFFVQNFQMANGGEKNQV